MSLVIFLLVMFVFPLCLIRMSSYCANIALGWDVLVSAYFRGRPGETLSGRAGSAFKQGHLRGRIFAPIIDVIMWKKGHCVDAVQGDILRARAVIQDQSL